MSTNNQALSYDSDIPKGKPVEQTKQLEPGAREPYATGANKIERQKTKHKPFGKLGVKGFAD